MTRGAVGHAGREWLAVWVEACPVVSGPWSRGGGSGVGSVPRERADRVAVHVGHEIGSEPFFAFVQPCPRWVEALGDLLSGACVFNPGVATLISGNALNACRGVGCRAGPSFRWYVSDVYPNRGCSAWRLTCSSHRGTNQNNIEYYLWVN